MIFLDEIISLVFAISTLSFVTLINSLFLIADGVSARKEELYFSIHCEIVVLGILCVLAYLVNGNPLEK